MELLDLTTFVYMIVPIVTTCTKPDKKWQRSYKNLYRKCLQE